jgi:hypothetical protein
MIVFLSMLALTDQHSCCKDITGRIPKERRMKEEERHDRRYVRS